MPESTVTGRDADSPVGRTAQHELAGSRVAENASHGW